MKAHISLLALSLAACGGDDDGGGGPDAPSIDSALPAELTGQDILDALADVDGEGSGLDADTIDGIDSVDLARTTRRVVDVPRHALEITNDPANPQLVNTGTPFMSFEVRVPPDSADPPDYSLHMLVQNLDSPCGVALDASVRSYSGEGQVTTIQGAFEEGAITTIPADGHFTVSATFDASAAAFERGRWLEFMVSRASGDGGDTCAATTTIKGVAIEYDGR